MSSPWGFFPNKLGDESIVVVVTAWTDISCRFACLAVSGKVLRIAELVTEGIVIWMSFPITALYHLGHFVLC